MTVDPYAHEPKADRIKRITRDIYQRRHAPWAVDADIMFLLHQTVRDDGGLSDALALLQAQAPVLGQIFGNINKLRDDIANLRNVPNVMGGGAHIERLAPAAQTQTQPRFDTPWNHQRERVKLMIERFAKSHPSWVESKDEPAGEGWCEVIVAPQYEDDPRHCQNSGAYYQHTSAIAVTDQGLVSSFDRKVCGIHLGKHGLTYGPVREPTAH